MSTFLLQEQSMINLKTQENPVSVCVCVLNASLILVHLIIVSFFTTDLHLTLPDLLLTGSVQIPYFFVSDPHKPKIHKSPNSI